MVKGNVKKLNYLSSMVGNQQIMPKNKKPISSNTNVLFRVTLESQSLELKIIASGEGKVKVGVLIISVTNLVE